VAKLWLKSVTVPHGCNFPRKILLASLAITNVLFRRQEARRALHEDYRVTTDETGKGGAGQDGGDRELACLRADQ
jgi:hypothetical protein